MTNPYKDAARLYLASGIGTPLPLPYEEKWAPPKATTGAHNDPPMSRIEKWINSSKTHNIALRLSDEVIGIDVDSYKDVGAQTIENLERKYGKLPPTPRSTARTDGSGISFFRVPRGQVWASQGGPAVDIIQRGHRYAVVWPSKHPNGATYTWYNHNGRKLAQPPSLDDLAELPEPWQAFLLEGPAQDGDLRTLDWGSAKDELKRLSKGKRKHMCDAMDYAVKSGIDSFTSGAGRHDTLNKTTWNVVSLAYEGHSGVIPALNKLLREFYTSLAGDRSKTVAVHEFTRSVQGAVAKHDPSDMDLPCECADPDDPVTRVDRDVGREKDRHAEAVAREAERMRVQREAKDMVRAAWVKEKPIPGAETLQIVLDTQAEDTFRIEDMFPSYGRIMIAAARKTGKTTLIINLVKSLLHNEPFLGRFPVDPVAGSIVVADFEMTKSKLRDWYARAGFNRDDNLYIWNLRGHAGSFNLLDPDRRREIAERLIEMHAEILVLDPVRPVTAALGLEEQSNSDMGRFLDAVDALMNEAGLAEVIIVHHTGHEHANRPRGASVFGDWPDALWAYTKDGDEPDSQRLLQAEGRDVELMKTPIRYDAATLALTLATDGEIRTSGESELDDQILAFLRSVERATFRQVEAAVGKKKTLKERVGWLVEMQYILETVGPRKARIFEYPGDDFEPTLIPEEDA